MKIYTILHTKMPVVHNPLKILSMGSVKAFVSQALQYSLSTWHTMVKLKPEFHYDGRFSRTYLKEIFGVVSFNSIAGRWTAWFNPSDPISRYAHPMREALQRLNPHKKVVHSKEMGEWLERNSYMYESALEAISDTTIIADDYDWYCLINYVVCGM